MNNGNKNALNMAPVWECDVFPADNADLKTQI